MFFNFVKNKILLQLFCIIISLFGILSCHSSRLISILVTPANSNIFFGQTIQMTATGVFSDGRRENITSIVNWVSSNTNAVTIESRIPLHFPSQPGLATGNELGISHITAKYKEVTSNVAIITVTPEFVYFGDFGNNTVIKCIVNPSTGQFSQCQPSAAVFNNPVGLVSYRNGDQGLLFVSNNGSGSGTRVSQCKIIAISGLLDIPCTESDDIFLSPAGIDVSLFKAIDAQNNQITYLYVVNNAYGTIDKCLLHPETGLFTECTDSGAGIIAPNQLTLLDLYTIHNQTYAYVAAGNPSPSSIPPIPPTPDIYRCIIEKNGTITNCQLQITGSAPNDGSFGIEIVRIGENTIGYVTQGAGSFNGTPSNKISHCDVNESNGQFTNCEEFTVPEINSSEGAMGIQIININGGLLAYVTVLNILISESKIIQCQIDPNTKNFTNCIDSGVGVQSGTFVLDLEFY